MTSSISTDLLAQVLTVTAPDVAVAAPAPAPAADTTTYWTGSTVVAPASVFDDVLGPIQPVPADTAAPDASPLKLPSDGLGLDGDDPYLSILKACPGDDLFSFDLDKYLNDTADPLQPDYADLLSSPNPKRGVSELDDSQYPPAKRVACEMGSFS